MTRWKLILEYDGGPFVGWQRQETGPSVQAALEDAIRGFCGESVTVHGAGRTDSGVHALAQVAHFDLQRDTDAETVRDALNAHLRPQPIAVIQAEPADSEFHARFSATGRDYLYRIQNRRAPPVMERGHVWWRPGALDHEAMHQAAQTLIGRHDFTSFRAVGCQARSPLKTLDVLEVSRRGEEIHIQTRARSYLHSQVRIMVGTLERVGAGAWTAADIERALQAKDRSAAGPTAPPEGLYLTRVRY